MDNNYKFLHTCSWINFAELHMRLQKIDIAILCYNRAMDTLCRDGVSENLFIEYTLFEDEEKKNGGFSSRLIVPKLI